MVNEEAEAATASVDNFSVDVAVPSRGWWELSVA
jgi:hypothetical protein